MFRNVLPPLPEWDQDFIPFKTCEVPMARGPAMSSFDTYMHRHKLVSKTKAPWVTHTSLDGGAWVFGADELADFYLTLAKDIVHNNAHYISETGVYTGETAANKKIVTCKLYLDLDIKFTVANEVAIDREAFVPIVYALQKFVHEAFTGNSDCVVCWPNNIRKSGDDAYKFGFHVAYPLIGVNEPNRRKLHQWLIGKMTREIGNVLGPITLITPWSDIIDLERLKVPQQRMPYCFKAKRCPCAVKLRNGRYQCGTHVRALVHENSYYEYAFTLANGAGCSVVADERASERTRPIADLPSLFEAMSLLVVPEAREPMFDEEVILPVVSDKDERENKWMAPGYADQCDMFRCVALFQDGELNEASWVFKEREPNRPAMYMVYTTSRLCFNRRGNHTNSVQRFSASDTAQEIVMHCMSRKDTQYEYGLRCSQFEQRAPIPPAAWRRMFPDAKIYRGRMNGWINVPNQCKPFRKQYEQPNIPSLAALRPDTWEGDFNELFYWLEWHSFKKRFRGHEQAAYAYWSARYPDKFAKTLVPVENN
jgi:hypothetical protein